MRFTATEPEACVPLLARAYRDRAVEVGETASEVARELWEEGVPPRELLEPLVGFLRRGAPDFGAMDDSYALLGNYGVAASNAIPFVRERFGREPTNAVRINLAVAWTRIDPASSVPLDFLVDTALDEPVNPLRSAAFQGLLRVGPSGGAAARRLMEQLQREPSNAALVDVLAVMGKVPAPDSPGPAATLPSEFPPAIRAELIAHLHRTMQDAARTNALDHRLNPAWRVLQLTPGDAPAWAVFRSQLLQEVENDPTNGNVLRVSTSMEYLLSIPIVRERKKELLRDVQCF
ncbi:MAG: hypothetical protein ACKO3N_00690 [Verrucomicrobiota bacterium]